jgi:hypothetical protein
MNIDDALRTAMRREPAPEGFAARVVRRAAEEKPRRYLPLALAAGVALAVLTPSAIFEYRRWQALEARDQLRQALLITRVELQAAREKVYRNTRSKL